MQSPKYLHHLLSYKKTLQEKVALFQGTRVILQINLLYDYFFMRSRGYRYFFIDNPMFTFGYFRRM